MALNAARAVGGAHGAEAWVGVLVCWCVGGLVGWWVGGLVRWGVGGASPAVSPPYAAARAGARIAGHLTRRAWSATAQAHAERKVTALA